MFSTHQGIDPLREAGMALNRFLAERRKEDILILVPGGSAFSLINRVDPTFISAHTTIALLTERFAEDGVGLHLTRLKASPFWERALPKKVALIDPGIQAGEIPDKIAARFEQLLRAWHATHPKGIVIAILGIGADGHIAEIFPHPSEIAMASFLSLFETDAYACGYRSDKPEDAEKPYRVTVTNTYLRNKVDYAFAYVAGETKHPALAMVYNLQRKPVQIPACIIREMKHVDIYTDIKLTAEEMGRTLKT